MKSFIVKYKDEEGLTTYHSFNEGFSFSVSCGDLIYYIHFFDPALEDECVITAELYVEPANPFLHMVLMQAVDAFMDHALDYVETSLDEAVAEHISSDESVFDLSFLTSKLYDDLDEIAEKYVDDNYKGLPDKLLENYAKQIQAERESKGKKQSGKSEKKD